MESNGCLNGHEVDWVKRHNQAVRDGLPCLDEGCPVLLCPKMKKQSIEMLVYIATLERTIREARANCSANGCPHCTMREEAPTAA